MNYRIGSLFSGAGAFDAVLHQVLGAETAWFVENDPAASRALTHHWPDVPNYGDVTTVDWSAVEPVDVLSGGFPCQDVSCAGRRVGLRPDTRSGLWSQMAYAIAQLRPRLVVIENVRGLLSADAACDLEPCPWCLGDNEGRPLRALGAVLGDLAQLGYDTRWCGLRASDVGAPHGRFRVFITAWPATHTAGEGRGFSLTEHVSEYSGQTVRSGQTEPGRRDRSAADPESVGRGKGRPESAGFVGGPDIAQCGDSAPSDARSSRLQGEGLYERTGETAKRDDTSAVADPDCVRYIEARWSGPDQAESSWSCDSTGGRVLEWGVYEPAIRQWERILGRRAPAPTMTGQRGGQQLSPYFTEWMMGWPQGWVTAVPGLTRNDMIRICGNGVVPHQAAAALHWLLMPEARAA